jgi:hypothetical protein
MQNFSFEREDKIREYLIPSVVAKEVNIQCVFLKMKEICSVGTE